MNHILSIAWKDIRETLRDKMTFFFLLAMPIVFTLMFGFAFGGSPDTDTRLPVALLDQDGSAVSAGLKSLLEQSEGIRVEAVTTSPAELDDAVRDEKWAAAVIVPAGYGASLEAGQPVRLILSQKSGSLNGLAAQGAVQTAAGRAASAAVAAKTALKTTGLPFADGFARALAAWHEPPVGARVLTRPTEVKAQNEPLMPFSHTAPAMMVQFALAGLITAAQVMVHERKTHCMQRLLTTRASRPEILLGHFTAIFALIFTQFVLLVAFGQLILKLDYLRQPFATLLVMLCTALFVSAVGLLIGALAKNDDQAIIFAMIPMFLLSALGGAWMPLEQTGGAFRSIGQYTPVALAMDGFKNIIARGLAFDSVVFPASLLLGYAALFFALAVWKFRYE